MQAGEIVLCFKFDTDFNLHWADAGPTGCCNGCMRTVCLPDPLTILQVNVVDNGEAEYLFEPYSVFTVESVAVDDAHTTTITLQAALDNREERDDLPLVSWY